MTGFVDLDEDTLLEVFKRVDMKTLLRVACVNKLWYTTAQNDQLWFPPISLRLLASTGMNRRIKNDMLVVGASSSTASSSVVDAGTAPQTLSLEAASAAAASES
ncbi:hypothetical protein ACJW30_01G019500 [Castanea mollissima]